MGQHIRKSGGLAVAGNALLARLNYPLGNRLVSLNGGGFKSLFFRLLHANLQSQLSLGWPFLLSARFLGHAASCTASGKILQRMLTNVLPVGITHGTTRTAGQVLGVTRIYAAASAVCALWPAFDLLVPGRRRAFFVPSPNGRAAACTAGVAWMPLTLTAEDRHKLRLAIDALEMSQAVTQGASRLLQSIGPASKEWVTVCELANAVEASRERLIALKRESLLNSN